MTAPYPAPSITSPPAVPSDLGAVAQAIENQAVAAYAGYNTSNTPSATSLETRVTAIDASPAGSAAVLDAKVNALSASISTWTVGSSSNLGLQTAQTQTFGPRQDGQDATMSTITGNLATAESQTSNLTGQRPGGLLYSSSTNFNTALFGGPDVFVVTLTHTFDPRRSYRMSFSGTAQSTVGNVNQAVSASWILAAGTNPSNGGYLAGISKTPLAMTSQNMPFACFGVIGQISGTYTLALDCFLEHSGDCGAKIVGLCCFSLEDLGYRYY